MVKSIRYTCASDLIPVIETALTLAGYQVELPRQRSIGGANALIMSRGLTSILIGDDPSSQRGLIEIWGVQSAAAAQLLEITPDPGNQAIACLALRSIQHSQALAFRERARDARTRITSRRASAARVIGYPQSAIWATGGNSICSRQWLRPCVPIVPPAYAPSAAQPAPYLLLPHCHSAREHLAPARPVRPASRSPCLMDSTPGRQSSGVYAAA